MPNYAICSCHAPSGNSKEENTQPIFNVVHNFWSRNFPQARSHAFPQELFRVSVPHHPPFPSYLLQSPPPSLSPLPLTIPTLLYSNPPFYRAVTRHRQLRSSTSTALPYTKSSFLPCCYEPELPWLHAYGMLVRMVRPKWGTAPGEPYEPQIRTPPFGLACSPRNASAQGHP